MEVSELYKYRQDVLDNSKDEDGFIEEQSVLSQVLPYLLDAKVVDTEECYETYGLSDEDNWKINAYIVNDSTERLQLFVVDGDSIDESLEEEQLNVSIKADYEKQLKQGLRFFQKAVKGDFTNKLQDSSPVKALAHKISSETGIVQFDVIEIFLISLSATVSNQGNETKPRKVHFKDGNYKIKFEIDGDTRTKDFLIVNRVIDLNFIANVIISRGHREPLTVNFKRDFERRIEVIQAANEKNFESYLCVLDAAVIAELYKRHSSRLLEKNVRSFLQFKGVNKGIKNTIRTQPEQFIAFNNGLTITASSANVATYKKVLCLESLTDFQIVNGGQTTASIYFSQKEGLDISKVKVMAKITIAKDIDEKEMDSLISNISRYSNTQSRVSNVDLNSRSPQLRKIKSLSESIVTPSGCKWFFERAKGEFNTMVRKAGSNGARKKKEFPNSKRFSKEQLAKYYLAWGEQPHVIKKGGEKVFRHLMEAIEPKDEGADIIDIDRVFYENLIAKIILFRGMEKIYGQGKNAIGQLRSAVIPYSLSILYITTDAKFEQNFKLDLGRVWRSEYLENDLSEFLTMLMMLVNELIKKYSASDDYGEYSKKEELWLAIKHCREIKEFLKNEFTIRIIKKYTI
ncbi:AIPR family protein [Thalassomonas viridans]|uniref:AIPR family protein n=1 Tax=Thalassomonas viridans TaxID=137584 RepID=A0AAE9Z1W0_9GAMM|nr:AIPR family protein [Thalassomonas viridans]WDE03707.1 AIPR family protein [Thalassomonas viridans]